MMRHSVSPELVESEVKSVAAPARGPLTALLDCPLSSTSAQLPASSVALGRIEQVDAHGQVWLSLPIVQNEPLSAVSLCRLGPEDVGRDCAVQFIQGDLARPLVLGLVMQLSTAPAEATGADALQAPTWQRCADGWALHWGACQLQLAADELTLTCGDSLLRLTEEGVVQIRGVHVNSDALGTQRLRGGSVQVN